MHEVQRAGTRVAEHVTVSTVSEALDALAVGGASCRLIAGGTDLLLELARNVRPDVSTLIDISRVPGLSEVSLDAAGVVHVGPGVTHNDAVASPLIVDRALPLAQACWEVGSPQLRNRATIAGNLITASPANDTISALRALDASVTLRSIAGERKIALSDFYTGVRTTVMHPTEMLVDISFPALEAAERAIFVKLGLRRAQAISVVHVAIKLRMEGPVVTDAVIALGSVAPTIITADEASAALVGNPLSDSVIAAAAAIARDTPQPIDDVRATAEYRTDLIPTMVARSLAALRDDSQAARFPQNPALLAVGSFDPTPESILHREDDPVVSTINGERVAAPGAPGRTLLDWLREPADRVSPASLLGTKEGCAEGECGACTVFLDGAAVMSCLVPAARAHGAEVVTIEGLHDPRDPGALHPLQASFVGEGAVQCGFCIPGFLMSGAKLIEEHSHPTPSQVHQGFSGNLCRCTGYYKMMDAVELAASRLAAADDAGRGGSST